MHYFVVELYGNLIETVFENAAQYKLGKVVLISKEYRHDVSAHCGVQNLIQNIIPGNCLQDVVNEFNPMFFPNKQTNDEFDDGEFDDDEFETISEDELLTILENNDIIPPEDMDNRLNVIKNDVDIIQSNHYFVDEYFNHLLLFAKVVSSGDTVANLNLKQFKTLH